MKVDAKEAFIQLRKAHNLTQMEFAKWTRISQSNVSKIEAGKKGITLTDFKRVLASFDYELKIERKQK